MATLADIRKKLQESQNRASGSAAPAGDSAVYPHWNMAEGKEAVIRFLPDKNPSNTYFWVERAMIRLPFAGIKGETDNRQVVVTVPCVEMYNDGSVCPILNEVRAWFKDKSLEELGRKYWKKRSYLFQGFVVEDALKEETPPENPIRRFVISPQIFQIIRSALMDPELEELPTDYLRGIDFRIAKSTKGGYADYSTSKWSRRERALSEQETAAIEQYDLFDLATFLPKKPTDVELKVMKEMFEASVDGEPYDLERWGQYFKPAGVSSPASNPRAVNVDAVRPAAPAASAPADDYDDEPVAQSAAPAATPATSGDASSASRAQDILAMIRNRQKQ